MTIIHCDDLFRMDIGETPGIGCSQLNVQTAVKLLDSMSLLRTQLEEGLNRMMKA